MITDVVLHFMSDQPLVCDLRSVPTAGDAFVIVTNLRFVDGRKPGFIDHVDSWFLYPLSAIRFIELPADALDVATGGHLPLPSGEIDPADPSAEGRADEDADALLRRVREL